VVLAQFCSKVDWIAAGVDLDRVHVNVRRPEVITGDRFAGIDRILIVGPAVLRIQAVGHENDDVGVDVQRILGRRRRERPATDQRGPAKLQADPLVGVAGR
jgi:hypothetical protein